MRGNSYLEYFIVLSLFSLSLHSLYSLSLHSLSYSLCLISLAYPIEIPFIYYNP